MWNRSRSIVVPMLLVLAVGCGRAEDGSEEGGEVAGSSEQSRNTGVTGVDVPECIVTADAPRVFARTDAKGRHGGIRGLGTVSCSTTASLELEVCLQWRVSAGTWEDATCVTRSSSTDELELEPEVGCPVGNQSFRTSARAMVNGVRTDWSYSAESTPQGCPSPPVG